MRVLQTIISMRKKLGGPSTCTCDLMDGISKIASEVKMLTVKCTDSTDVNAGAGSPWLIELENDYHTPLSFSDNAKTYLNESNYDVYHANTIWGFMTHITCKMAREKHKPYIISPHGMLYPTALHEKHWKKLPMLWAWYNKDIREATCLHVTCKEEMEHCRKFGYRGPIAIIPNAVVIPYGLRTSSSKYERKTIGFLGRLDKIKKVENILYAASLIDDDFDIEIMGKGDALYETFLKDEVTKLGLDSRVRFVGFVGGQDKYERLSKLWGLFVPSVQENFGMIVPEALICGTPVYASLGTPWQELNDCNCGWWKDNSPETIAGVIKELLTKTLEEISVMGENGRKLIEEKYEQHKVAQMMYELYRWVNGECVQPEFVHSLDK